MSRESEFLLAALSGQPLPPATVIDWHQLEQLAQHHRVTPLLMHALQRAAFQIPEHTRRRIEARVREVAHQNLLLFAHTERITAELGAAGINALALKGPVLSHQLYGDLHYRVCSDVDLLVPASDFARAAQLLLRAGYETDVATDERSLMAHRLRRHDLAFGHADGTLVELHADIAQPHYSYRFQLARWFERAECVMMRGRSVAVPCPAHALVLAVVHGTKHVWSRLDLVADVAAASARPLDEAEVARCLREAGAERAAAVAGELATQLLGRGTRFGGGDREARRIAAKVAARLTGSSEPSYWQIRSFDLAVRERLRDRVRYATRLALNRLK